MSALVVLNVPQFPRTSVNALLPEDRFRRGNPVLRMWQNMKRQIVDDVPEALAICQFDCRRAECLLDVGRACDRVSRKGAGQSIFDSPLGKPVPAFRVFSA